MVCDDCLIFQADRIIATIRPKSPMASAKIRIRIIPTNSLGSIAFMRTPTSPTTPIAKPDAYIRDQARE